MSQLPLVIVNPASALGATGRRWPAIASDLRTHFGAFTPAFTKKAGDGRIISAREATAGREFIIACGGDGTINEVASGILESGTDAELGVLPSGTGGDFRRTLNLSTNAANVARALQIGRARRIDAGRVTFIDYQGAQTEKYFVGVASFGMSGDVIRRVKANTRAQPSLASRLDWLGGRVSFAVAALGATLSLPAADVIIQLDDKPEARLTLANLCVANARYFGGGMKIAPQAKVDDGRFDVIAINELGALELIANAPKLYTGAHLGTPRVRHTHAFRITARPAHEGSKILLEVDGELPGYLPATFVILPHALRVRFPA
jgi:diacylglycerol kinase (ATP)